MEADRPLTVKPAARRNLDLAFKAEGKRLRREVLSIFATPKTQYKTAAALYREGVWNRIVNLFRETGSRFGVLAHENAQVICDAFVPDKEKLVSRVRSEIAETREETGDRAYARYRLEGGSPRRPRGTGETARALFRKEFAVAEYEAVEAAIVKIYLPDRKSLPLGDTTKTSACGSYRG
jgi:hypothetical protein